MDIAETRDARSRCQRAAPVKATPRPPRSVRHMLPRRRITCRHNRHAISHISRGGGERHMSGMRQEPTEIDAYHYAISCASRIFRAFGQPMGVDAVANYLLRHFISHHYCRDAPACADR